MNKAVFKDGSLKFDVWFGKEAGSQSLLPILVGASGIGLSIIDYLKGINRNWDRCLLIDF